ncbi:lactonase family protein [Flavobacterium sp. TMP13]|uniref:lactonase family protein n=1 Tax=Flavobacterium sp. TMP13 TaxID=3425950 RepID=UPI003D778381
MKKLPALMLVFGLAFSLQAQQKLNLLIGTYTTTCESNGIYTYEFDTESGLFSKKNESEKTANASYLTVSPDNKFVYSVNEIGDESTISAFGYDAQSGQLNFLNKESAKGGDPCYIINDGKNVIAANYSGGNISVFKTTANGISEAKQIVQHTGKGSIVGRQDSPHVHMVHFSPDKKYVLVNDLGLDKIFVYKYNRDSESEILTLKSAISVKAGTGPRHLTFSENGKNVYLVSEMDGSLTTFCYKKGSLKQLDVTTILDKNASQEGASADIHTSPDGKFLYVTNRGEANDISVFKIGKKGKLAFVERISTGGKGPRNFAIDPTGKFVLVGHQYTNNVVIFKRDSATGKLTNTNNNIELCSPVCLVFTKQ